MFSEDVQAVCLSSGDSLHLVLRNREIKTVQGTHSMTRILQLVGAFFVARDAELAVVVHAPRA